MGYVVVIQGGVVWRGGMWRDGWRAVEPIGLTRKIRPEKPGRNKFVPWWGRGPSLFREQSFYGFLEFVQTKGFGNNTLEAIGLIICHHRIIGVP